MTTTRPEHTTGSTAVAVRRSAIVPLSTDRAFALFSDGFATWWPAETYHLGAQVPAALTIEPGPGGRWYERAPDGTECDWGEVVVWDPPRRLVLAWRIDADWRPDPTIDTEVEVRFHAIAGDTTRVEVEHRGLEAFGDRTEEMVEVFGSDHGWGGLIGRYTDAARSDVPVPTVEVVHVIPAAREDVWRAIVDPGVRGRWWGHLDLDARLGGRFEERWTDGAGVAVCTRGEVTGLEPARRLVLRWADDGWPAETEVSIDLDDAGRDDAGSDVGGDDGVAERPAGSSDTRVRVRHTGWERLPDGGALANAHRAGWVAHLDALDAVVTGSPQG